MMPVLQKTVQIILALRDSAFEGNVEKLATALGRPVNEIRFDCSLPVDSDGLIKARGLAEEQNVDARWRNSFFQTSVPYITEDYVLSLAVLVLM